MTIGPPIGGLLLSGCHGDHPGLGTLVRSAAGFRIAWRFIPRGGAYAPEGPPQRGSFRVIIRDSPFLLFLASSVFATMTYVDWFNHQRLHGEITNDTIYSTPAEFEADHYSQKPTALEDITH